MLSAYARPVSSNPAVDFLEGLAQNAGSATVNLTLPTRDGLWYIRAISIIATQNLVYELQLFTSEDNMGATIPTDNFCAAYQFAAIAAQGAGYPFVTPDISPDNTFYHFYAQNLMIPYWDKDAMSAPLPPNNAHLHVRLINRSAGAKNAGGSGALQVTFYCTPQGLQP